MIPVEPWVAVAAILVLQPLIALIWAYVVYRAIVGFTVGRISKAVDERVNHAVNQIKRDE